MAAIPALNDYCHDNAFSTRLTSHLLSAADDSLVQSRRKTPALEEEVRELNWTNLAFEESAGIFSVLKRYKFVSALPFMPIREEATRPFKFRAFSRVANSAVNFSVSATLVAIPCVEI